LKINIPKPIAFIVLAALFASCNSGNKVVSSIGKRKYTKGYYFNLGSRAKPELPTIAANRVSENSNQPLVEKNKEQTVLVPNKSLPIASSGIVAQPKQKKIDVLHLPQVIIGKVQNTLLRNDDKNVSGHSQWPVDYGVPGHGDATETENASYFDRDAKIGLTLGILSAICAAIPILSPSFTVLFFLSILFAIIGLLFDIPGLRSDKLYKKAVAGLILIGVVFVLWVIVYNELLSN